jgi:stage II sporulation protein D
VTIAVQGAHRGFVDGMLRFETPASLNWPVTARGDTLLSGGVVIGRSLTLEPLEELIQWQDRTYRGGIRLIASEGRVQVINVVDVEDYLRGVVPAEMQASWPLEALKAQAVAARTYTLASLESSADYDLCATVDCQVYRGVEAEHQRSDKALEETDGVVLTFGGSVARTFYHADSGGIVASSAEVWGVTFPYLVAQTDVATTSPHRRWDKQLDPEIVSASLRGNGFDLGIVQRLRVLAYSESGRVRQLEVSGSDGALRLEGRQLRTFLRAWGLKSTRFRMIGALTARGDGWGHGVGMSQYGARSLAQSGYSYSQILSFYYPSTTLQRRIYTSARP